MRLPQDLLAGTYTKPRLFLCETDKTKICQLETTDMSGSFKFNTYSELSCSVGRAYEDIIAGEQKVNPFFDKIEALRLLYLEGFGYFEIQEPEVVNDGIMEVKNITANSLEYTLSQKYLENFKINTGEVDSVEVMYAENNEIKDSDGNILITPVTLYNQTVPSLSLLHLVLEKIYGWKIGHVDASLRTVSRSFDISRGSVYDFITQDICEKFNCFIVFDTIENTINIYAEAPVAKFIGDGKTQSFNIFPAFNTIDSVTVNSYKTTKYTYEIIQDEDGDIIGVLTLEDIPAIDADIQITDGSQKKYSTDVYITFDNLAQEINISYSADDIKTVLTVKGADDLNIHEVNMGLPYITDLSYYCTVDWMGEELYQSYMDYTDKFSGLQKEYLKNSKEMLEISNFITYEEQRLSLQYSIAEHVHSGTVGKYYVRGGTAPNYYYKEVSLPAEYNVDSKPYYTLSGNDLNETKVSDLFSALQTYYTSQDEKDVSKIEELAEPFAFMETNTIAVLVSSLSNANSTEEKDNAVCAFFDEMWEQLGRTPLKSLYLEPYTSVQNANQEAGWNDPSNENYWLYHPVILIIDTINNAISIRDKKIAEYQTEYDEKQKDNSDISNSLLVVNNFTEQELIRLNAFLREDEYVDDNFIETESDTIASLMQTKQELLECGKIELSKLCKPKLAFSMEMANIYALEEFTPMVDQFQLGNLIMIELRPKKEKEKAYVKSARLLQVNINFEDFSDFSCEFGELTNIQTPSSIHADLLATALQAGKTVASNVSYWNKGSDLATSTDLKIQQGLLDVIDGLYSSNQGVIIDKNGIKLTKIIDPTTGELSPNQAWIRNNGIYLSSDGFKNTTRAGLGEFTVDGETFYGIIAEAILSGYIESSKIVGGTINIGDGTFMVDEHGNVSMNAASIKGYVEKDGVISSINQSPETIAINANKISLAGKTIDLTSDNIVIDSTNFSVTKDGKITATSGEIAGWAIYPGLFRKDTTVDGVDYQIYMQSTDGSSTSNAFVVRKRKSGETDWDYQFKVNYEGALTARNANITGTITAKDGSIAGYNIGPGGCYDNALYKRVSGDSSKYEVGLKATSGDTDLAFYVKESTDNWASSSNTFFVRNNGQLYAQKADITGKITASSGSIGSWTIGDMGNYTDSIYSTYCAASTPSSSNPEYAVFMRGKGAENTLAFGVKKRTSSSTSWNDADNPFYVRKDGYVRMANANVTGTINSTSGSIGGFDISSKVLRSDITKSGTRYQTFMHAADGTDTTTAFGVRTSTDGGDTWTYQFRVNYDGSAVMRNATITGNSTIASACIPNLSADKITAGTLDVGRIPNIDADKITSGTFGGNRIHITSGGTFGNWTIEDYMWKGTSGNYRVYLGPYTVTAYIGSELYSSNWPNICTSASGSDIRFKKDVSELENSYDNIFDNLKPVSFQYNQDSMGKGLHLGFIAQDVVEAFKAEGIDNFSGVYPDAEGYYQLVKQEFIALNTWQIQKLKTRIEELENRLAALES